MIAKDAFDEFRKEQWKHIDGIILSPGPGTPQDQPPLSHQAISENSDLPILGVCLGHQLMALNYGAKVDKAPTPVHGQDHCIIRENITDESPLFRNLPSSFRVVRYHSLAAYDLPECLKVVARSEGDNVIQAIQHSFNPHYGVQFHPESIGTQHGMFLIENFCRIVQAHKESKQPIFIAGRNKGETPSKSRKKTSQEPRFRVIVHPFQAPVRPEEVFESLYEDQPFSMWLDSSSASSSRGELDILAAPNSESDLFEYHRVQKNDTSLDILSQLERELFGNTMANNDEYSRRQISNELAVISQLSDHICFENENRVVEPLLPFDYRGGFLGYLGYEVRHDTEKYLHHIEGSVTSSYQSSFDSSRSFSKSDSSKTPTAAFFLARNSLVYYHPTQTWYMISLIERGHNPENVLGWMMRTKHRVLQLNELRNLDGVTNVNVANHTKVDMGIPQFIPNRSKETYKADIATCHKLIREGESYELCLTNQLEAHLPYARPTFKLYKVLRRRNPAPYSAYFHWQKNDPMKTELTICCSSPERFMSVRRKQLHPKSPLVLQAEAKPIKGTAARILPSNGFFRTPAENEEDQWRARNLEVSLKNRAENLMIVDLLRNDMSRVCQTGSIHVSKLMAIESFATVHQMVSTIRGTLALVDDHETSSTCINLLRASFPGGSMTGAPKIRTMELLEAIEQKEDRGPYSGSLGYISVNGCMDMNIIIRSAIVSQDEDHGQRIRIGAGGAITALSDTDDEYEEMLLKTRAVMEAVQVWATGLPEVANFSPDGNATLSSSVGDPKNVVSLS